jgi:hypothetical protein
MLHLLIACKQQIQNGYNTEDIGCINCICTKLCSHTHNQEKRICDTVYNLVKPRKSLIIKLLNCNVKIYIYILNQKLLQHL